MVVCSILYRASWRSWNAPVVDVARVEADHNLQRYRTGM
jgi:hypothetical protein